jgi:hypothetical protein
MMEIHGEEIIRRIVREEMRSLLESMAETADGLANGLSSYDVGDLEKAGHRAIKTVMELEESMLPHAWNCISRDPRAFEGENECTCGVKEGS